MLISSITLLLVFNQVINKPYDKYMINSDLGARCLDGSQAAVYISKGELNNTLIFFTGQGYCQGVTLSQTLQSCYIRAKTESGSSVDYPDTYDLDTYGILSTDQNINPNFWNWTKVYVPYCDGSLFQGTRLHPISYKDKTLYFRGLNNTLSTFEFLNQQINLYSSPKIILTGASTGGVATFQWSNYLYDKSTTKNIFAIPDSGLFINKYLNPTTKKSIFKQTFSTLFKIVNNQTAPPLSECVSQLGNSIECFEFDQLGKYFKSPMFIIESQYDKRSIETILGIDCLTQDDQNGASSMENCTDLQISNIDQYRQAILSALKNFTLSKNKIGIWAPSCIQHTFEHISQAFNGVNYKIPGEVGNTISTSIANFIKNPSSLLNIHIDTVNWPSNKGCSNFNPSIQKTLQLTFH